MNYKTQPIAPAHPRKREFVNSSSTSVIQKNGYYLELDPKGRATFFADSRGFFVAFPPDDNCSALIEEKYYTMYDSRGRVLFSISVDGYWSFKTYEGHSTLPTSVIHKHWHLYNFSLFEDK